MRLGIALGGGGARGLSHIGVLEVLEEHNIKPYAIAGTSIGSMIGAIYCLSGSAKTLAEQAKAIIGSKEFKDLELNKFYTDAENVLERFKKELFEKFYFGSLLFKKSHSKKEATKTLFKNIFGKTTFKDCAVKFTCNALDIQSGEEVVFDKGLLADAVWASCAIPGIFPPYVKGHSMLVDGGVIDNVPIDSVKRLGATNVVAVYLGGKPHFHGEPDTGFRITYRAQSFVRYYLDQKILAAADCIVTPETDRFHWADFSPVDALILAGRNAAQKRIKRIRTIASRWYGMRRRLGIPT